MGTFEELTEHQGEIALVLEYNSIDKSVTIISVTELGEDFSKEDQEIQNWKLAFQYALASDLLEDLGKLEMEQKRMCRAHTKIPGFSMGNLLGEVEEKEVSVMKEGIVTRKGVVTKKKYKLVAKKVKPIIAELPGQYRIIRDIKGDSLENMTELEKVLLSFLDLRNWRWCSAPNVFSSQWPSHPLPHLCLPCHPALSFQMPSCYLSLLGAPLMQELCPDMLGAMHCMNTWSYQDNKACRQSACRSSGK